MSGRVRFSMRVSFTVKVSVGLYKWLFCEATQPRRSFYAHTTL